MLGITHLHLSGYLRESSSKGFGSLKDRGEEVEEDNRGGPLATGTRCQHSQYKLVKKIKINNHAKLTT